MRRASRLSSYGLAFETKVGHEDRRCHSDLLLFSRLVRGLVAFYDCRPLTFDLPNVKTNYDLAGSAAMTASTDHERTTFELIHLLSDENDKYIHKYLLTK